MDSIIADLRFSEFEIFMSKLDEIIIKFINAKETI